MAVLHKLHRLCEGRRLAWWSVLSTGWRGEEGEQCSGSIFATEWMNLVVFHVLGCARSARGDACSLLAWTHETTYFRPRWYITLTNETDCMVQNVERLPVCVQILLRRPAITHDHNAGLNQCTASYPGRQTGKPQGSGRKSWNWRRRRQTHTNSLTSDRHIQGLERKGGIHYKAPTHCNGLTTLT